jgi:hypothetical protein
VLWDADADAWGEVGSGVRATSRVTFDYQDYFSSVWHHGQPITMADVMYGIAQSHDRAYDEDKSRIETALAVLMFNGPRSRWALASAEAAVRTELDPTCTTLT